MKKNVLVVDDDASVRRALGKVLEEEGYIVTLAADGGEALDRFEAGPVDVLLLDIGLPIKNGWDTFEHITSRAPTLPIIIITGKDNQHDMAVAAGVGALMEKPLDVSQLLKLIEQLLVESPEARLRRLCGFSHDLHYAPPARLLPWHSLLS